MVYKAGKERGPCHESFASDHELPWPEDSPACSSAGSVLCLLYSRWMYSYMNRVLRKGSQQQKSSSHGQANELSPSDLYKVPKRMEASNLSAEFWSTYDSTNRRFLRTLWCLAAPTFIPAGLCQFIAVVAQVSIPLLVRQLLIVVETHPKQSIIKEGLPYAILLFVTSAINALFNHRHHHLSFKSGIIIRSAVADAVYEHALRLSPTGRLGLSTAQITNMVAIDSQKLFEVMQEGHLIWSCPLAILIVSALLLIIIGISSIVGIVALILTLPLVKFVVTKMIQVRGERVKVTDERIEIVTSMLQGIKVTKLNNYEEKFEERVLFSREREMKLVRKEQSIWAWTLVIMLCTPVIATAATFATYVLISEENILTASMTFTTLMLFSALRFPINYGGKLIGKAALGYQAAIRMSGFFTRDVLEPVDFDHYVDKKGSTCEGRSDESEHRLPNLAVTGATFVVGAPIDAKKSELKSKTEASLHLSSTSNACFTLFDISFSVAPSEVLAVVGTVGSGKTSLVKGLIGEIDCTSRNGKAIMRRGRIAYASQTPFILNATVRDNILFGTEFDQARYQKVLDACCLRPDLQQLGPGGEMTEIGERGVTLSGGQKQRISLGRAVYAMPDIAIFDDPLSALDASTSRTIFENLFDESPKYDLLSSSAVVLVTHASHFLHRVNHILFIHGGRQVFHGTFDEMSKFECDDLEAAEVISAMQNTLKEGGETDSRKRSVDASVDDGNDRARLRNSGHESDTCGEIMTIEDREHGLPTLGTWLLWFKYAGGWMFVLIQVLFMVIERTAYVGIEWWLAIWTDAADEPVQVFNKEIPPQTHGISAQYMYLQVYAVLFVIMTIFAVMRSQWAVSGGTRCAKLLFSHMTTSVLRAPMSYFETTPMGRVLNRFTHDVEMVDTTLTQTMTILIISLSWFVASVVVMTAILPWLLAVIVPVVFAYALVLMHYRKSAADLQRLDVMSRSPVQALLAEGLDGAATIRSFGMQRFFVGKFQSSLDSNCTAMLNFISAHRWLAVRIEMLGALVTLAASLLVTLFNDKLGLDPGVVGLLITWSSNFTIVMGFFVDSVSESEAAITSIERIHRMSELPREQSMTTPDENQVDPYWPREGTLQFVGTKLRYRSGLNLALDGLSFTLEHGKRCGVVGRTGAGKSSITAALFRLVEIESGQICLDGVDLASLGLEDVRGRPHCMSIIPQDPVLFAGTLRECLDPFGLSTDEEILDAMRSVQISNAARGVNALNDIVEEGGANFSVGERQLLCLARALLVKPKLLVLDEATASVDDKTDMFIQKLLRRRFCDTTLLTIAHRLNTIMDYDNILVMDGGKAVEFGSPSDLLQIQGGAFSELVDATGAESAAALKLMADKEQMKIFRPCN